MSIRKILISGGAGFIGSNLAMQLVQKGYKVRVLDNLSEQIHGKKPEETSPLFRSIKNKVEFIKGSITSKTNWEEAIKDQQAIIHCAAETGTGQSMYMVEKYTHTNIQGTAVLLDILSNKPHQVKKIVLASSRAIYGEGKYLSEDHSIVYPLPRKERDMKIGDYEVKYPGATNLKVLPTDEKSMIHPSSIYGITKQVQEQILMNTCKPMGIALVIFRYQNVYGPGQSLSNPYTGIISIFSNRIRSGQSLNIFEDGFESRDFVYIDDVVNATIAGIESDSADNEILNVGTGKAKTVTEIAKILMTKFRKNVPMEISGMFRIGDIRHNFADISRLREKLGVRPKIEFAEGIDKFVDWVSAQSECDNKYDESLKEMRDKGLFK